MTSDPSWVVKTHDELLQMFLILKNSSTQVLFFIKKWSVVDALRRRWHLEQFFE